MRGSDFQIATLISNQNLPCRCSCHWERKIRKVYEQPDYDCVIVCFFSAKATQQFFHAFLNKYFTRGMQSSSLYHLQHQTYLGAINKQNGVS